MNTIDSLKERYAFKLIQLSLCVLPLVLGLGPAALQAGTADGSFFLKAGDHVCFYGDSITEQRFYGADVETYVRTRFPNLQVKFVNSGVGGDRVTGGWAGRIDRRLKRDVFPFKPNVVTIMLGMNDAQYRPFDQAIFNVYTNGYEHIIQSLQAHLPGVRIVLIQTSPYDDVTERPRFQGGYNAVLSRYCAFVRQLAKEHHLPCVDFYHPLLSVLREVHAQDPKLAHGVIPGRIHPSAAGELVMAQALLQAWNAPATVTAVTIQAPDGRVTQSEYTVVHVAASGKGHLAWTQKDACLPFPILALHDEWPQFPPYVDPRWFVMSFEWPVPKPDWNKTNTLTARILKDCGFYQALDQEPLHVTGLASGTYRLDINGQTVGRFSAQDLDAGINLAEYRTPILEQSYRVLDEVWKQIEWRFFAWREIQLKLSRDRDPAVQQAAHALVAALEQQKQRIVERQYAAARPRETRYTLTAVSR